MKYDKNLVYKVEPENSVDTIMDSIYFSDDTYKDEIKFLKKFAGSHEYKETIKLLRKSIIQTRQKSNEEEDVLEEEQYKTLIKVLRRIEGNYKNIYKPKNNYDFKELSENLVMDYKINETFTEIKKDKKGFLKNFKSFLKNNNFNKEILDKNKKRYESIKNTVIRESQSTISFN